MFEFTMSATMLNNILSATSSKGHIFILPSENGLTFTNSPEEDDTSVYSVVDTDNLEEFLYEREDDVYCFMVGEISPLISRIRGMVTLAFDEMSDAKVSYIHIKAKDGKFEGKTALKDEEFMEDTMGLTEHKRNARFHQLLDFNDREFFVPKPMTDIGNAKIFHFEQPLKPLIIESDNVIITINNKKKEFLENIKTDTSEYNFKEMFDANKFLSKERDKLGGIIELAVTSAFLEGAIKKHQSPISDMMLIDLPSEMIPYNIVFLSEREVDNQSFYTASILSLRVEVEE